MVRLRLGLKLEIGSSHHEEAGSLIDGHLTAVARLFKVILKVIQGYARLFSRLLTVMDGYSRLWTVIDGY